MADSIAEIRKIFADKGIVLPSADVWSVQGTPVVKHKALERLAAVIKVRWHEPKILRAERDEAVILVTGAIGDHIEWSIGEAMIVPAQGTGGNYKVSGKQASYVWAMAEKRGKDRVIIKLAGIEAYSEEESEDFKSRGDQEPSEPHEPSSDELYMGAARAKIKAFATKEALADWWGAEKENRERMLSADQRAALMKETISRRDALTPNKEAA